MLPSDIPSLEMPLPCWRCPSVRYGGLCGGGCVMPGTRLVRRAAARCWAMLLARIYECLPLACPECGKPMQIISFILDRPVIERILDHIGEPTVPPPVSPARAPPQATFDFDQATGRNQPNEWPEMDQTAGSADDTSDDTWD